MKEYQVWQNAWKDGYEKPINISLPDSWNVQFHEMPGDRWAALTPVQMREKIQNPISGESIREKAGRGKTAAIAFDDLSRATPCREIAKIVLEELLNSGVRKEDIRFICALGTHAPLTRADFVKKLGEDIVSEYAVFNHNAFACCEQIGTNSHGDPVMVNKEFLDCDIRIGIGSVTPHPMNGFGGGGKLIFPGLAHVQTTACNHTRAEFTSPGTLYPKCGFRKDIEEMLPMVGDFFKIDAVINAKLDIIALYAGNAMDTYYAAAAVSAEANRMEKGEDKDVVIVNANAKYNESKIAVRIADLELKPGGTVVLINHCPCGQVVHYSASAFGMHNGGHNWIPPEKRRPMKSGKLIYYTPWPDWFSKNIFNEPDKVAVARTWDEVLENLAEYGDGTTASVLSDGSISYFG